MSIRCHSSTVVHCSLYPGWGTTGAVILATTASGSNGPGLLFPGTTVADNTKEISYRIVTPPSAGVFTYAEDGTFSFTGAPDGIYSIVFEKYDNQVSVGQATSTVTVGTAQTGGNVKLGVTLDGRAYIPLGGGLGVTLGGQRVWVN